MLVVIARPQLVSTRPIGLLNCNFCGNYTSANQIEWLPQARSQTTPIGGVQNFRGYGHSYNRLLRPIGLFIVLTFTCN